ncbi:hypothetical protein SDRG_07127 [Saprolegnia diclina VS20]|uniref:Uncharacterized protein n=1 Tax=Saprolegnia diclina (strain VS20) TaxID=1156394 RepID=T0RYF6_SAPDV|nr:hypothetical protein SDRG_07127 [Saprolegnia diclina VS20]EQC35417.1 hypothetical protein SDRG_07127 [Saprolegnia diclina VS20]|eukprot:XP_008611167.1 hypothetical protein SDRG_07127 [Saprolegnia diclina VS20]
MATRAGIWGHDADTSSDSDDGVAFRTLALEDDEDDDEEYAPSEASDAGVDDVDDDDDDDDEVDEAMIDETLWADEADRVKWERWFERENAKWKRQHGLRIDSEAQPLARARLDAELRRGRWRRLCFFLGFVICAVQGWLVYQVHSEDVTLAEAWTRLEALGAKVLPSLYSALHEATTVDEYSVDRAVPSDDGSNIKTQDDADAEDAPVTSNLDEPETTPDASEAVPPTPDATTAEDVPSAAVEIQDVAASTPEVDNAMAQVSTDDETTVSEPVVEVAVTIDGDAALSTTAAADSLSADGNELLDEEPTPDTRAALDGTNDDRALETPHELEPATVQGAVDELDAADIRAAVAPTETTAVDDVKPTADEDPESTTEVDDASSQHDDEAVAAEMMEPTAVDPAPIEGALTACTASLQAMVRANYTDATKSMAEAACDAARVASLPWPELHQRAWTRQGDRKNLVRDFAGAQDDYIRALSVFPSTPSSSLSLKLTSTRWLVLYIERRVDMLQTECDAYLEAPHHVSELQHIARSWLQVLASDASEVQHEEATNEHLKDVLVETRKLILL